MTGAPITFDAVAQPLAELGWRPFPGHQETKIPAMQGWNGLNNAEWDRGDLAAAIAEYQPAEAYCCCLAIQTQLVALDLDITDTTHAETAAVLADEILGKTPLIRIGLAPKNVRIYRNAGGIRSRKLHPLEIFAGSGQIVGFGWHEKAGRPYKWPQASPLEISVDKDVIPLISRAQLDCFTSELFKLVPRRLLSTRQGRINGFGGPQTIGERLGMLTMLHGSWKRAAGIVLSEAVEGCRNETGWVVVASAAGNGVAEDLIWRLFERHFTGWGGFSESDLASAINRTRHVLQVSTTTFGVPSNSGGGNAIRR
ncbi:MAG TPA: bifunctional DNA primase/polymerase [Methylocella sp.]|jgi:hypothetical protein